MKTKNKITGELKETLKPLRSTIKPTFGNTLANGNFAAVIGGLPEFQRYDTIALTHEINDCKIDIRGYYIPRIGPDKEKSIVWMLQCISITNIGTGEKVTLQPSAERFSRNEVRIWNRFQKLLSNYAESLNEF